MFGLNYLSLKDLDLNVANPQPVVVAEEAPKHEMPVEPQPEPMKNERVVETRRPIRNKETTVTTEEGPKFAITPDAIELSAKNKLFTHAFEHAMRALEFDRRWNNGTGYFDGIFSNPDCNLLMNLSDAEPTEDAERFMKPGEVAKAVDNHGRRLIIVATRLGPVVVFQRYKEDNSNVFCMNAPHELTQTVLSDVSSALTEEHLYRILGDGHSQNIGQMIEKMFTTLQQKTELFFEDMTIQQASAVTMASVVADQAAVHH